jgi:hypothetical protein
MSVASRIVRYRLAVSRSAIRSSEYLEQCCERRGDVKGKQVGLEPAPLLSVPINLIPNHALLAVH